MARSDVMTAAEAAARLRVQHITIQRWAKDGRLKPIRKAPLLFDVTEVERRADEMDRGLKTRAQIARAKAAS